MKKNLLYCIAACSIVVVGAIIAAKTISDQRDPFFDDNIEALTDLELNQPIWLIHQWENGDYNCTKGGYEVCIEDED